jgi:hypothetical protein
MLSGVDSRTLAGPSIVIHCAACNVPDAPATTYQYGERLAILHVIPLTPYSQTNYVKCERCGEAFVSPIALTELPYLEPGELHRLLRRRVGLVEMFLAVAAIILSWIPFVGLVMSLIALAVNGWRKNHWTRPVSRVAAVISVVVTGLVGAGMALNALFGEVQ